MNIHEDIHAFRRLVEGGIVPIHDDVISQLLAKHHPIDVMKRWWNADRDDRVVQVAARLCDLQQENVHPLGNIDMLPRKVIPIFIERGIATPESGWWITCYLRTMTSLYDAQNDARVSENLESDDATYIRIIELMESADVDIVKKTLEIINQTPQFYTDEFTNFVRGKL